MPVRLVDAMAQAIYVFEGNGPKSRAYRNNNPGNLRLPPVTGRPVDDDGYRIFPSFVDGYNALVADITSKITGNNSYGLNADSSIDDFFSVYAPERDSNDPYRYADFVATRLSYTYNRDFGPKDTFRTIMSIIGQSVT